MVRATDSVRNLVDTLVPAYIVKNSTPLVRPTVISSARLLQDAADTMAMVAERAGIDLAVDPHTAGAIFVDYPQMLRVLANLIGNCVKYCPRGSSVRLNARELGEDILISVADDGPGISISDQAHVFDRGWQGSDGIARQDGSGLGLAIVRSLVEQNGGTVTLVSRAGYGTEVTVRMPGSLN